MILYIGSERIFKEIENATFRYNLEFIKNFNIDNIKKIYKELQDTMCPQVILDISFFNNSYDEKIIELKKIKENIKLDIAIIDVEVDMLKAKNLEMIGYTTILEFCNKEHFRKTIIEFIKKQDGHNVSINSNTLSPVEKQILEYEEIEQQKLPPTPVMKKTKVTIGIGGILPRMGSTTLAIQMMKYLKSIDRKALYVEMGKKELLLIKEIYENYVSTDNKNLGFFSCDGLDFLYKVESLDTVLNSSDYEFIIFDYGHNVSKSNVSFISQDIKFLLCGMSPSEMLELENKLQDFDNIDMKYFFNLVANKDKEMILDLMKYKRDDTYFLSYTPDYFILNEENIESFSKLLEPYLKNGHNVSITKKNSFFERFKR